MMEGSNGNSNSPAPFLVKTYEMVDDPYTRSVVSWSRTGQSFVVWNPPDFARDLLPKYFKHNNFSSFIRQLNTYGFRKVDPDQWEFANEEFIQGQRQLLKNIHRRKPIHSHSGQGNAVLLNDSEREEFEKEIEKLKQEKFSLQSEIEQHKQENESYAYQLRSLGQTLQTISQRQHKLVSNLAQMLYKPTSNITDQSESQNKKRRLLAFNYLNDESNPDENNQIINFQENVNLEAVKKLESSLNFWETFLIEIKPTQSGELHDFSGPLMPSAVTVTEMSTSSKESDLSIPPCSPECNLYIPSLQESHSPPEMSSLCINSDSGQKTPGVDINVTATVTQETQNDRGNDVFWLQFLTEVPNASLTQEVQSQRRELGNRKDPSGFEEKRTHWWNVDKFPQPNGHVTHVERM